MHQIIPVIDVEFERDDGFLFRQIAQELLRRRTGIAVLRREKLNNHNAIAVTGVCGAGQRQWQTSSAPGRPREECASVSYA
jgi:hypothetical protein